MRVKVSDPIMFYAPSSTVQHVARPCSSKHREYWLAGYIVASCRRCIIEKPEPVRHDSGTHIPDTPDTPNTK